MEKKTDNVNETDKDKKTNKEKILSSLLESPKTNTQLLTELGYKNNQHKYISKDLDRLKKDGFIVSEKIKSENLNDNCTQWSLVLKFENLSMILKKYSELLQKVQNSDIIREYVCNNLIFPLIYYRKNELSLSEEEDCKERLRLSPEYFKYYILTENINTASENIFNLAAVLKETAPITSNSQIDRDPDFLRFKICVLMDIINGQSSSEASNYLIEKEKKRC